MVWCPSRLRRISGGNTLILPDPASDVNRRVLPCGRGALVVAEVSILLRVFAWLGKWVGARRRRDEQIDFLRRTIFDAFVRIGEETPHIDINGYRPPNAVQQRTSLFKYFLKHIEIAVNHRTGDLTYSERAEIQSALADAKSWQDMPEAQNDWDDMVRYGCIYRRFQRVRWLELPPKFPWKAKVIDPLSSLTIPPTD